jgi:hypothetical protein
MGRQPTNQIVEWMDYLPELPGPSAPDMAEASRSIPVWVLQLKARPGRWAQLSTTPNSVGPYGRLYPTIELAVRDGRLYARWPEGVAGWWE